MAEASQRNTNAARRVAGLFVALLLLATVSSPANAGIEKRYKDAKERLAELRDEIERQQVVLDQLSAQAAALWERLEAAQARFELITQQLMQTRAELASVRDHYEELQTRLDDRLRQTYMSGPATSLEFLLGAATFADLSDRVEYVDAIAQTDADLATRVENLRNELTSRARAQVRLQRKQADLVRQRQNEKAALDAKFADQQALLDDIEAKRDEGARLVETLGRQYRHYLASLSAVHIAASGVFRVCPVDQPRAVYDGFGAPRYAGGYHPHGGNDIVAPLGTEIRAPFDGTARTSYSSLGGNSVYVYGSQGYVYNAHLDHYSDLSNGPVHAGDVIGYVGWTGDAVGGVYHDHFEWHPFDTPSPDSWPASIYGYSVIDTGSGTPAVNPYPLLEQVC